MVLPETKEIKVFKDVLNTTKMEAFEAKGLTKGKLWDGMIWEERGIMDAGIWAQEPGSELIWDYIYNMFAYIVEGDFQVQDRVTGKISSWEKGDLVFVPVGSKVIYRTNKGGKMVYCCHPPFAKMFEVFSLKGTEIPELR